MTERRTSLAAPRPRLRRGIVFLTAVVLVAGVIFATGPHAPARTVPIADSAAKSILRGAFHVHTTRSDGALDKNQVAAAAARAGLQFAIFTDHGDGTRPPDPPAYIDGVLCIDGVEISTNDGHYIGVGLGAAPYPLGGDGSAVAEDVARLGGLGVVAHAESARTDLAWSDWDVPFDGIEWLNADSEWRDETRARLSRSVLDYIWRPAGALAALLDRPVQVLNRWDDAAGKRRVVGVAAHDAHGGLGAETDENRGRRVHVPSYESSFRTFSIHASLAQPLTGNPDADGALLLEALREGRIFTAIDAIAAPADFNFSATAEGKSVAMGGVLPEGSGTARFHVRAAIPRAATVLLLRNGRAVAESRTGELKHDASEPGAYRVEISVPTAPGTPPVPWLVSNPIYRFGPHVSVPSAVPSSSPGLSLMTRPWRVESDPGSSGTVTATGKSVTLTYRLRAAERASQFVALVVDLDRVPDGVKSLLVRGNADRAMRVSAQLRFARDGDTRWRKSVYLDAEQREAGIGVDRLRRADPPAGVARGQDDDSARRIAAGERLPDPTRATSLLFVVDLTNAAPGAQGSLTLTEVALVRDE